MRGNERPEDSEPGLKRLENCVAMLVESMEGFKQKMRQEFSELKQVMKLEFREIKQDLRRINQDLKGINQVTSAVTMQQDLMTEGIKEELVAVK